MDRDTKERYQFSVIRERMRQHSGRVLNFALGDLQHPLPESVSSMIASGTESMTKRASREEHHLLGEQASAYLSREFGVVVEPEEILAVPGARIAMTALTACLLAPGDGVVVTEPGYPAFARVAAHRHCRLRPVPLDPSRGFIPDISVLATDELQVRMAALNYPNNPTGAVLTSDTVSSLAALGTEVVLFNDATYGPLVYDAPPRSLLSDSIGVHDGQPVVELHSLGKLFAMGPLASSFVIGSPQIIEELLRYSDFAWAPMSALHLQVAAQALAEEDYFDRVRDLYHQRVRRIRNVLEDLGFEPYPTPAGMYVLTRVPTTVDGIDVQSAQHAADLLLDHHGLAVAAWDISPNRYLRFSSLYSAADLAALVELKGHLRVR